VPLVRRTIRTEFTEEELEQVNNPVVPAPPATVRPPIPVNNPVVTPIYQQRQRPQAGGAVQPDGIVITSSGRRFNRDLFPSLTLRPFTRICITGKFTWPGTRADIQSGLFRRLGLLAENNPDRASVLVVARTTGVDKIRTALQRNIPIYSEYDFYTAVIEAAPRLCTTTTDSDTVIRTARSAQYSALSTTGMLDYIRRV
jgi:hypothetical protein